MDINLLLSLLTNLILVSVLAKENKKTYKTKTRNFKRFHVMDMEEMRKYFLNKERNKNNFPKRKMKEKTTKSMKRKQL